MLNELIWFLPWCWFVNMSLTVFGFVVRKTLFLKKYDMPLDGGLRLPDGRRILGEKTTTGGIVFILIVGAIGATLWPGHYYFLLAVLVKVGDMLGSFVKRRLNVPSGTFLPGIDHGDYVLVAGAVIVVLGRLSLVAFVAAWLLTLILTPVVTSVAYNIGIRKQPL